jgi:DNA-binding XRE family transcriptional regulator
MPPRPTADEVRELRLMNGMSQKNLAHLLCVSQKSVEAWEQGHRNMPASTWLLMYLAVPTMGGNCPYEEWPSFVGEKVLEKQGS